MNSLHDVARIRLDNAMRLFDEFVAATIKAPDAATLRGLERRFAERLQIQPSYWSQIKSRSRQIGERLARQFEQLCRKPVGWMDLPHDSAGALAAGAAESAFASASAPGSAAESPSQPQDDDERFIVGLVLTYYRRHPHRARSRLLDLLGEVLTPPLVASSEAAAAPARAVAAKLRATRPAPSPKPTPQDDDLALWTRLQSRVAPLKPKR